jgi:hypothetical protein
MVRCCVVTEKGRCKNEAVPGGKKCFEHSLNSRFDCPQATPPPPEPDEPPLKVARHEPPAHKPFPLYDSAKFDVARSMFLSNTSGWGITLAQSLGLLRLDAETPGGCIGCHFNTDTLTWMLDTVSAVARNTKTAYLGNFVVQVHIRGSDGPAIIPQGGLDALSRVVHLLESFGSVVARFMITWDMTAASHAGMVTFDLAGSSRLTVTWSDPEGPSAFSVPILVAIRDHMRSVQPGWAFVPMIPNCVGPQTASRHHVVLKMEPDGYCETWASVMILYSVALDGVRPEQVIAELESMYPTDRERFLLNFVRVVSRNVARFVRELNPQDCPRMNCCRGKDYCEPPFELVGPLGERVAVPSTCYPEALHPNPEFNYRTTSMNGMWWFTDKAANCTLGVKLSPAGRDPNFWANFRKYAEGMRILHSVMIPDRSMGEGTSSVCYVGGKLDKVPHDIGLILLKSLFNPRADVPWISLEVSVVAKKLGAVSDRLNLSFRPLLTKQAAYVPLVPDLGQGILFLDLDLLPPLLPGESTDYTAELEKL